jgi:hypothetical protein
MMSNFITVKRCSLCHMIISPSGISGKYDHPFRLICDACYDRLCDLLEGKE